MYSSNHSFYSIQRWCQALLYKSFLHSILQSVSDRYAIFVRDMARKRASF